MTSDTAAEARWATNEAERCTSRYDGRSVRCERDDPLVGFSGHWPRVYHLVREEPGDRSLCSNFTQLDFYFHESEMAKVNEDWATSLTPCRSCERKRLEHMS